jgi:microcystin-dependent protein
MDKIKFTNFALSQLATSLSTSDTSILVEAGHGARFPVLTGDDFFYVTMESAALVREIVKVTARAGDTLTVVRGQDGTTAVAWAAGSPVALRANAAALDYVMETSRQDAISAAASAATATTKAGEASTSATAAAASATTATTQATNAATSASTATTKASEASTSATNAATSASTATTQASNAATSATNAANSAAAAADSAEAAATWDPSSYYTQAQVNALVASVTPAGTIIHVAMNTAPSGYLKANGAAVSRTTYAALFTAIGTTFGAGNGSTTFNLPDLRGEFIRGWDDGRGVDSGRAFGSAQLDQMQRITGSFRYARVARDGTAGAFFGAGTNGVAGNTAAGGDASNTTVFDSGASPDARVSSTTAGETRPRNVALLACIKF